MDHLFNFLSANEDYFYWGGAACWIVLSLIVKTTRTTADDSVLRKIAAYLSILHPRGAGLFKYPLQRPGQSPQDDR